MIIKINIYYDYIILSYSHVSLLSCNFLTATMRERPSGRDEKTKKENLNALLSSKHGVLN